MKLLWDAEMLRNGNDYLRFRLPFVLLARAPPSGIVQEAKMRAFSLYVVSQLLLFLA